MRATNHAISVFHLILLISSKMPKDTLFKHFSIWLKEYGRNSSVSCEPTLAGQLRTTLCFFWPKKMCSYLLHIISSSVSFSIVRPCFDSFLSSVSSRLFFCPSILLGFLLVFVVPPLSLFAEDAHNHLTTPLSPLRSKSPPHKPLLLDDAACLPLRYLLALLHSGLHDQCPTSPHHFAWHSCLPTPCLIPLREL